MAADGNVTEIYFGKPGCMCGCLGKWYRVEDTKPATMAPLFTKLLNDPKSRWDEELHAWRILDATRNNIAFLERTVDNTSIM